MATPENRDPSMSVEVPSPRRSPERIGRYQIIERIGRGAMGVVYRARDEAMGREVALKVLTADLEDDPDIRTRFHREAEAAARLSHPNIITIFDVGDDGFRFFMVMELLRGAPLKDYLKQPDGASLDRKIDLMLQLCSGLGAAHRASIVHRDVKPGNIFVRTDGILKILDFGVARLASSNMTASGFIVGTPDYMSPEQARGKEIDARSDIFSLGGVCYFMLSGRKPFPASDLPTLFHQIQDEDPRPIDLDVPPPLAAIVMKALSKRRESRYQTCQEVAADLERARGRDASRGSAASNGRPVAQVQSDTPPQRPVETPLVVASHNNPSASGATDDTDDTVDGLPVPSSSTDDTVSLTPQPTWTQRAWDLAKSAISTAVSRLGRAPTSSAADQSGSRRRSM